MALLSRLDGFAPLRHALGEIAKRDNSWAGIPMPQQDLPLVIEPSFPNAAMLMSIGLAKTEPEKYAEYDSWKLRNVFWSSHKHCDIVVFEKPDGRVTYGVRPGVHHFEFDLNTMGAADAWGIEQEHAALVTLGSLIPHHAFKRYLLTGMFLESSPRSGLTYMFRKLKPTVVMTTKEERVRLLCTLCLHPIGYYSGSWAGAMCPTDDVISHLMLMRGDEPMFWRRANHHACYRPEAGL